MTSDQNLVHDDAEKRFREALQFHPDNPKVLTEFALFLVREKRDFDEAARLFQRSLELDPNRVKTLCGYGHLLARVFRAPGRARPILERGLQLDPDNAQLLDLSASCAPNLDEEISLLERAIAIAPQDIEMFHRLAFCWREKKQREKAVAVFDQALLLHPEDAHTHWWRGKLLRLVGRRSESKDALARAAELHPDCHRCQDSAFHEAAWYEMSDGDLLSRCEKMLSFPRPYYASDSVLRHLGSAWTRHPKQVERILKEFLKRAPDDLRLLEVASDLLAKSGTREDIPLLEIRLKAAESYERLRMACCEKCFVDTAEKQEESFDNFVDRCTQETLAINPFHRKALRRAAVHAASDYTRKEEAEALFRRCLETDPADETRYLIDYADLLEREEKPQQAIAMSKRAVSLRPDDQEASIELALTLWRARELDGAESSLRSAARTFPGASRITGNLGRFVYEERDQLDEAERYLRRAMAQGDEWDVVNLAAFLIEARYSLSEAESLLNRDAWTNDAAGITALRLRALVLRVCHGDDQTASSLADRADALEKQLIPERGLRQAPTDGMRVVRKTWNQYLRNIVSQTTGISSAWVSDQSGLADFISGDSEVQQTYEMTLERYGVDIRPLLKRPLPEAMLRLVVQRHSDATLR